MTDYLDRLGAELRRAAYDQPRPRRLPRGLVPAMATAALLAVVVLAIARDDASERPAATTTSAVDAQVGDRLYMSVPPGPQIVGASVTAGEPVQILMAVTTAGESTVLTSITQEFEPGSHGIDVQLPPDLTGTVDVTVTVTDGDGNEETFERSTSLGASQLAALETFGVLRSPVVPEPQAFPATFLRAEFGESAEYHEAFSDPNVGQVWAIRTTDDGEFCTLWFGPADGVLWGCVEYSQAWAQGRCCPIVDTSRFGNAVMALVPDGTTDAEVTYADGTSEAVPIRSNVVFSAGEVDEVRWTAPDRTRQNFSLP